MGKIIFIEEIGEYKYHIDRPKIQAVIFGGSVAGLNSSFIMKNTQAYHVVAKENNFDINFINGGIEGQSSAGMVSNFKIWLSKLKNFSPKYIIFYVGINDSRVGENILSNEHDGQLLVDWFLVC